MVGGGGIVRWCQKGFDVTEKKKDVDEGDSANRGG